MNTSKIEFISDLLNHKDITTLEKERLFILIKDEIKKMGDESSDVFQDIISRLERLEIEKGTPNNTTHSVGTDKQNSQKANPKDVAKFMSLFNNREGFKYLTHNFDEVDDFDIDNFLLSCTTKFADTTTKRLKIPKSLWSIVNMFAFKREAIKWRSISENYAKPVDIEIGWGSDELITWSRTNKKHPIENPEYYKIINSFRRITRIEQPNLKTLVETSIDKIFSTSKNEFDIKKIELEKADFYTHVEYLKSAFDTIFEEIKKRSDNESKKKIRIEYKRDSEHDFYIRQILITHYNSFPVKELKVLLNEWRSLNKGSMGKIGQNMLGYCYWSIITKIDDKPIKINIIKEDNAPYTEDVSADLVNGFTHIFTFYYK